MMNVPAKAKETQIEMTIYRADGRVERLGVVAYWHRNPLRRWLWNIKRIFAR